MSTQFCHLLINPKINSFGCHGNQGVNPFIMAVLDIYRCHEDYLFLILYVYTILRYTIIRYYDKGDYTYTTYIAHMYIG